MPQAGPRAIINAPPTAGPSRIPSCRPDAIVRTALWSWAAPTMSWTRSCAAGAQITPAKPCSTKSTAACQTSRVSVRNRMPQPDDTIMNRTMPNWMIRRGSNRSASAPA